MFGVKYQLPICIGVRFSEFTIIDDECLSFEPFAHFCCVGKITILKYASASPKVGSILLRCDVGGWEGVSSFATLLFELCTISILLFGVEEAYPRILSKTLHSFRLTTTCEMSE